ncbi:hypothetical protein [Neisseria musculi]|uniref:hypothetical protein n=1 Tax=Neisseria musculi TaxID=1815583 RepID=UPI003618264E
MPLDKENDNKAGGKELPNYLRPSETYQRECSGVGRFSDGAAPGLKADGFIRRPIGNRAGLRTACGLPGVENKFALSQRAYAVCR